MGGDVSVQADGDFFAGMGANLDLGFGVAVGVFILVFISHAD
jgi:hypothetical protein